MKLFSKKQDDETFFLVDEDAEKTENTVEPSHALTPQEVLSSKINTSKRYDSTGALDSLKKRMREATSKDNRTLLEKCKPFILDEDGKDASLETKPAYTLEPVEEILKTDDQKVIDQLAQKYDISFDYLGKYVEQKTADAVKQEPKPCETEPEKEEFEDKIKIAAPVTNVHSSVPYVISDIDSDIPAPEEAENDISSTSTITFTPVTADDTTQTKIVVTTKTQAIDLTGEFEQLEDAENSYEDSRVTLEKNEFEDFIPETEFETETDGKKLIRKFSLSKRRSFISSCLSVFITVILALMEMPFMSGLVLGQTRVSMIICTALAFITVLLNVDMFASLTKIFSKKSTADVSATLAAVAVLVYAVVGIVQSEIVLDLLLGLGIILSLRAIGKFRKDAYMLSNLRQIMSSKQKNAVRLIDDSAITFAMAKNSIEGDALIAATQKTDHIADYMKYSTFGKFLSGKLPIITVLSLILSVAAGFTAYTYFEGLTYGFYAAAAIQCFAALPSLFFIDNLPLYSAAKKLNKWGAMISGKAGAEHIETANALVLNSTDLFPIGTVTLHQMKVLSENNLDETILRAASLTETLHSPLAPIFKRIAGESNITTLPDSDTVKYEDKMGISGWVDNKLLFIGNRTLMEAHGITVPSVEVDRKILRGGYFPVYVASGDKVCALLIVQYDVSPTVTRELRRLTKLGVTVLVSNTDPNISKEMICDYLGLYEDSVMLMSTAGCHMYKSCVSKAESVSAPAAFKGTPIALAKIMNAANKIRRSNTLLSVLYIITAILGIIIFAYSSFNGSGSLINSDTVLIYTLISTAVSYILYLTQKP